jgi:hypothetical protein
MSFKVDGKTISTKITLGKARKLAEDKIVDLLDRDGVMKLNDIFSSPVQKLDFLYEVVKDQVESQESYEENLDIQEAFESLEVDIANFFQAVDTTSRWESLRKHNEKVSQKQIDLMESVLDDPKIASMMDSLKDSALAKLGTELKDSQES